jgi:type II secretory pathway predicted ATPase ExeA
LGHRLLDLSELRIELDRWEEDETAEFLRQSVVEAGGDKPIFDHTAQARLHELAEGTPRQVNQLAQLAMLAGAGQQLNCVDVETVESAYEELSIAVAAD